MSFRTPSTSLKHKKQMKNTEILLIRVFHCQFMTRKVNILSAAFISTLKNISVCFFSMHVYNPEMYSPSPTWMFIFLLFFHVYGIRNCLLLIYSFIYMYDLINFLLKIKKFTVTCKSWNFRWKSKEFIFSSFPQLLVIIFLSLLCMNEALNLFY